MWLYIGIGVLVIIGIIILGKVISGVEEIFKVEIGRASCRERV